MSSGTFSPALDSSAALTGRSVRECPTPPHPAGRIWTARRSTGRRCRRPSPGTARCGASLEVVEEIGSTNAALAAGRGRGRPRGDGARRRAPGRRPGPAGPGLDVAAAGRAHRLLPAAPRRAGRPPRLAAAADRGGPGRGGRRGHRRPRPRSSGPTTCSPSTAASWPASSPRAPATAVVVGVGLNVNTTAEELPDTGTSLARRARRAGRPRPGPARLPPRGGAALPALDGGPRRPGLLRPGRRTTWPGRRRSAPRSR